MKKLTSLLIATVALSACQTNKNNCVFKTDCSIVVESDFISNKFLTKKELKEKDALLFKSSEINLF